MCKINRPVINVAATAAKIKECRIRAGYSVREIQNIFRFSSPEAIYAWEKGKPLCTVSLSMRSLCVMSLRLNMKMRRLSRLELRMPISSPVRAGVL